MPTLQDAPPRAGAGEADRRQDARAALRAAKTDGEPLRAERLDLCGASLAGEDLSGLDLSGADLSGADLSGANLSTAKLVGAKLREAKLIGADLGSCELLKADLGGADLTECRAERAGFGATRLQGATLFNARLGGATLTHADLRGADLRTADLVEARLLQADLRGADLSRANLQRADLHGSRVDGALFVDTDLRDSRLRGVTGHGTANWIEADILGVDFSGAYLVRRTIVDQNYLHEFRMQSRFHRALYWVWWATSDCGRSFGRWALWTLLITVVFAGAFGFVALDYGDHPTPLSSFYYSLVTLTTLGYGDVVPASAPAQAVAMLEVVVGYFMLGGLLGIFANKMGRRAD